MTTSILRSRVSSVLQLAFNTSRTTAMIISNGFRKLWWWHCMLLPAMVRMVTSFFVHRGRMILTVSIGTGFGIKLLTTVFVRKVRSASPSFWNIRKTFLDDLFFSSSYWALWVAIVWIFDCSSYIKVQISSSNKKHTILVFLSHIPMIITQSRFCSSNFSNIWTA